MKHFHMLRLLSMPRERRRDKRSRVEKCKLPLGGRDLIYQVIQIFADTLDATALRVLLPF